MERVSEESQEGLERACYERFNDPRRPDVHIQLVLAHVLNRGTLPFFKYHPVYIPSSSGEFLSSLEVHDTSL